MIPPHLRFWQGVDLKGSRWVPVAFIGLSGVLALLFVHIFMVILLAATALMLGKGLVEWFLGPGTRIRVSLPWSMPSWSSLVMKIHRRIRGR